MYIAMNRFRVRVGREDGFETVWRERDSHLDEMPGFVHFRLLRGPTDEEAGYTLFASHTMWRSREDFAGWTRSDAFKAAHRGAGSTGDLYLGHPQFEGFESLFEEE